MSSKSIHNRERDLAEGFILHTNRSVFLTGKAGTGKTTLLREIIKKTKKSTAVVAPTGVAAINAKGVTIHSFFQLPTTTFLPTSERVEYDRITNRKTLAQNQKLRTEKRQLIVELELLIIDEISMVRADLLDAIDFTLRRIRKRPAPFGGVQLLVIGDLFQLAPIVKPDDWNVLKSYYKSPFFFDAIAWQESNAVSIELQKVYRQADQTFISVLNRIRNGISKQEDIDHLNLRYDPFADTEEIITLTTHNRKADSINNKELDNLLTKSVQLKANVTGHFAPSAYPTREVITIKEGAQIMFVKNHPDGIYYNGKLGTIETIDKDKIKVHLIEDDRAIDVVEEQWKNTKYVVDPETKKIEQQNIGTFEQYPFRLAWAITVHKSQGLTFEDVILDLENTFAPGQLYVALSRCRSLEGIKLSTRISTNNIIVDRRVSNFYGALQLDDKIDQVLASEKETYEQQLLLESYSVRKVMAYAENWEAFVLEAEVPQAADALVQAKKIIRELIKLDEVAEKFRRQMIGLQSSATEDIAMAQRYAKGINYFTDELHEKVIVSIQEHITTWKKKSGSKKYVYIAQDFADECWNYIRRLYSLLYKGKVLYTGAPKYKQVVLFDPDRKKKKKRVVGETYKISLEMFQDDMTLEEIAEERKLSLGTIQSHMSKLLKEGKVEIESLLSEERINKLKDAFGDRVEDSSSEIMKDLNFHVSYAEISWIRTWMSDSDL